MFGCLDCGVAGYAIAIACLLGVFSSFGDSLGCGVSGGLLGVFLDGVVWCVPDLCRFAGWLLLIVWLE